MNLTEITNLTKLAYNRTAEKYHAHFQNEVSQKDYDRNLLDRFSGSLTPGSLICDAGCGPSGHIGNHLAKHGHHVTGIDISPRCIEIAKAHCPNVEFRTMDMMNAGFADHSFDAVIAFYSIIYTPKDHIHKIFSTFNRILKTNGKLLVVVKKGTSEGMIDDNWYEGNPVYFTHFSEEEMRNYFVSSNFSVDSLDTRKPYDFEFNVDRIYTIGTKVV